MKNVSKNVQPATKNQCIKYLSTAGLIVGVTPVKKLQRRPQEIQTKRNNKNLNIPGIELLLLCIENSFGARW